MIFPVATVLPNAVRLRQAAVLTSQLARKRRVNLLAVNALIVILK